MENHESPLPSAMGGTVLMGGCNILFSQPSSHDSHHSHVFVANCKNFFGAFLPQLGVGEDLSFYNNYIFNGSHGSHGRIEIKSVAYICP
jgi:hypothetical protein